MDKTVSNAICDCHVLGWDDTVLTMLTSQLTSHPILCLLSPPGDYVLHLVRVSVRPSVRPCVRPSVRGVIPLYRRTYISTYPYLDIVDIKVSRGLGTVRFIDKITDLVRRWDVSATAIRRRFVCV